MGLVALAGCASDSFTDAVYLHKKPPGPVAEAKEVALQKAIDDDHGRRVKVEAMQVYFHLHATNMMPRDATQKERHQSHLQKAP